MLLCISTLEGGTREVISVHAFQPSPGGYGDDYFSFNVFIGSFNVCNHSTCTHYLYGYSCEPATVLLHSCNILIFVDSCSKRDL